MIWEWDPDQPHFVGMIAANVIKDTKKEKTKKLVLLLTIIYIYLERFSEKLGPIIILSGGPQTL